MNQWIAWCWGTILTPPFVCNCRDGHSSEECGFTRRHYSYGLLIGRVFVGITVSRAA